jgi:hypothetical protein
MKRKLLVVMVSAMMLVMMAGSALPALAQSGWGQSGQSGPQQAPPQPVCGWDWDRYLWQTYQYELWSYTCDYGKDGTQVYAFWNPDWGYWYP